MPQQQQKVDGETEGIGEATAIASATTLYQSQWPGEYVLLLQQERQFCPAFHGKHFDEIMAWLEEWFSGVVGPPVVIVPPRS